jgi:hypothetical protein
MRHNKRTCNGFHKVIMRARCMIDAITPALRRTPFEAEELRSEALVIKKINAPRIQQRQQRAIKGDQESRRRPYHKLVI